MGTAMCLPPPNPTSSKSVIENDTKIVLKNMKEKFNSNGVLRQYFPSLEFTDDELESIVVSMPVTEVDGGEIVYNIGKYFTCQTTSLKVIVI